MKSLKSRVRLFETPWTHHAPPSMEFSRQKSWSGLPLPSPGDLPDLGIKPQSPALRADALPSELPGNPKRICLFHPSPHLRLAHSEKQQQKKPSDGPGPVKGDSIYSSFFPGPPFTPPSPKASLCHWKPQAFPAPHQKTTLQRLPPEPRKARCARYQERQQVLAFFQKNTKLPFPGGAKKGTR